MDAKEAVGIALQYAGEIFGDQLLGIPDVEEVWLGLEKKNWYVTLSVRFNRQRSIGKATPDPLQFVSVPTRKVVAVAAIDGTPEFIRDWPLVDAA
jgi:hypothetical protein